MSVNLDLENDWQYIGDLETVMYFTRTPLNTTPAGVSIENVLSRATDEADQIGSLALGKGGKTFHLWTNQLAGIVPASGDIIKRLDGTNWLVKRVQTCDMGTRFRVETVEEV